MYFNNNVVVCSGVENKEVLVSQVSPLLIHCKTYKRTVHIRILLSGLSIVYYRDVLFIYGDINIYCRGIRIFGHVDVSAVRAHLDIEGIYGTGLFTIYILLVRHKDSNSIGIGFVLSAKNAFRGVFCNVNIRNGINVQVVQVDILIVASDKAHDIIYVYHVYYVALGFVVKGITFLNVKIIRVLSISIIIFAYGDSYVRR